MSLKPSQRMEAIAGLCSKGDILFDVGCDHAIISISLLQSNAFGRAVASDVKKGPLETARLNAEKAGVSERMSFILSDGLKGIDVEKEKEGRKSSTLLISGMGGELIERILNDSPLKRDLFDGFVFSPQSKLEGFRRYLGRTGLCIKEEKTVFDKDKFYFVIRAEKGEDPCKSDMDYELGPCFFDERTDLKKKLLINRLSLYEGLCGNKMIDPESLAEYKRKLYIYREAVERYEMP